MRHIRLVPDDTNYDFFRPMRFWLAVSLLGVIGTLVILPLRGLNYGVDFLGGTLILAEFPQHRDIGEYRQVLGGLELGDVAVTEASGGSGGQVVLMRIGTADEVAGQAAVVPQVQAALNAAFPGATYLQVDTVGGKVSDELVQTGVIAVLLALFAIMVYVWLRFEWQFGVGAVVSLLHDVIVTVGIFSLLQLQFDLTIVAALLTIIGFSINDTVVVFDRMRENLRKYKKMPLRDVMNLALNETLSRTMMTVVTTLIALFALLFFGGPVVFGFAFAVIFGIVCGTYSSIWVASAIVLWLGVKRDWSKADQTAAGTQFGRPGSLRSPPERVTSDMRTVEVDFAGRGGVPIDSYGTGGFRLAGAVHLGPLALLPAGAVAWAGLPDLRPFLERTAEFDLLIVGLGPAMAPPDPAYSAARAALERAGIGLEFMATPTACRSYNVMLAEGRRVAAALMPT